MKQAIKTLLAWLIMTMLVLASITLFMLALDKHARLALEESEQYWEEYQSTLK